MRIILVGVVGAVMAFASSAFAEKVIIGGRGTLECSIYNNSSRDKVDEQWILGYVSAYAIATGHDVLKVASMQSIYREVDSTCKLKDQLTLQGAVHDVVEKLSK
jgi:hypothetical protein